MRARFCDGLRSVHKKCCDSNNHLANEADDLRHKKDDQSPIGTIGHGCMFRVCQSLINGERHFTLLYSSVGEVRFAFDMPSGVRMCQRGITANVLMTAYEFEVE
jgi:hypothetical protein